MARRKTPRSSTLDAEVAASLTKRCKKRIGVEAQRADYAKAEQKRVRRVAELMADLTGDDDWLRVSHDGLSSWLDLGPVWNPTSYSTRELAEQLIEQSVEPKHVDRDRFQED